MTNLQLEPLIAPALWVTLAALAVAVLAWSGWHRPAAVTRRRWAVIVALTGLGMAAVLAILLNPTWVEPVPPPAGKPLLTVLLDRSGSMRTADAADGQQRYEVARRIAESTAEALRSRFEVRVRTFAEGVTTRDTDELARVTPDGPLTDLAAAIDASIEADRPQGQALLVVGDGVHNAPGGVDPLLQVARSAKALSAPVFAVPVGAQTRPRDLSVHLARPQELTFAGQTLPVLVRVTQRGQITDRAEVILTRDGQEVAREAVPVGADGTASVRFPVRHDQAGLYRYDVRAVPVPGEATTINNTAALVLRVVDEPVRVLLLEGKPYWDAKFLIRTLAADPSVEIDSVVRMTESRLIRRELRLSRQEDDAETDGESNGESDGEPVRRTETTTVLTDPADAWGTDGGLGQYQVVVLGRDAEMFLDERRVEQLRTWIARDGGSLVCYRGSPVVQVGQELARLLPVRWDQAGEPRFRMVLTESGSARSWLAGVGSIGPADPTGTDDTLTKMPSLASVGRPERAKPLAVVLARSQGGASSPLVTWQPYGSGRVVVVEGAGMWRWALLAPQYQTHDGVYRSLWQSLLRWLVTGVGLVAGQDMALRTDKVEYVLGETVSATLLMREEVEPDRVPAVELTGEPTGNEAGPKTFQPVPVGDDPGVYRVVFGKLPEGQYTARVRSDGRDGGSGDTKNSARTVAWTVRPYAGEMLDVAARPDLLARIAEDSGGAVIASGEPDAVARAFAGHIARTRPSRVRRLTAWDRWWVLAGIIGVWAAAWTLRRSSGLI